MTKKAKIQQPILM